MITDQTNSDRNTDNSEEIRNSWVLFKLLERIYGIKTEYVHEMVILDKVVKTPDQPETIRGVINLRGSVFPVLDLSKRLGLDSMQDWVENICGLLDQRENDHINWLNELKASVLEKRKFKLTTNPHACAFGKWYDSFKTDNRGLHHQLSKFDKPHKLIHSIAVEVEKLVGEGEFQEALKLIDKTWNTDLHLMRELFAQTRSYLRNEIREIVIVVKLQGQKFGIIVNTVSEVRDIKSNDIAAAESVEMKSDIDILYGIGKLDENIAMLIDIQRLI